MNPVYTKEHLDYFRIWESETAVIHIFIHGLEDDYKAIWFTVVNGICHPVNKIEFRNSEWMLKLIHKEGFHPTQKHFRLVEDRE
jgi:hypothetical protein